MSFVPSRLKIERANKHIADFGASVVAFLQANTYTVRVEKDPESGDSLLQYGWANPAPIEKFSLVVGDAVHNLRSALDLAWNEVVSISNFSKFPIFETEEKLVTALRGRKMHEASPELWRLIVDVIKPYERGNNSIWAIHRLDIWRVAHPLA